MSSTRRKKSSQADGYAGILAADIHFPENSSLKDKRQYLRSLKAGLARRLGASVAEVGYHDRWQRSRLMISVCSPSFPEVERALDLAVRFLESRDLMLAGVHREIVKVDGGEACGYPGESERFWRDDGEAAAGDLAAGDDFAAAGGD